MDMWLYGHMTLWLYDYDYMTLIIWHYGHMTLWSYDSKFSGNAKAFDSEWIEDIKELCCCYTEGIYIIIIIMVEVVLYRYYHDTCPSIDV